MGPAGRRFAVRRSHRDIRVGLTVESHFVAARNHCGRHEDELGRMGVNRSARIEPTENKTVNSVADVCVGRG